MTDVLITGITGFIGQHLAKILLDKGYNVYGIIKYAANRDLKPLNNIKDDIVFLTTDLTSYPSVANTFKNVKPDFIVHLAALSPVRHSFERPHEYEQANILGTMNVVHALMELPDFKSRRLLVASTAEVYGIQEPKPFYEDLQLKPSSPYAVTKAAADMYVRMAIHTFGLNAVVLRPTNSYGRKFDTGFLVEYLVTQMLKGNKVYIGAPDSIRDYMYVDDHVNGYVHAIEKPQAQGEVFNVGTGIPVKNRELVEKIAKMSGKGMDNIVLGSYPPGYPQRPLISDQPYLVLDPKKIKSKLGWEPKVSLEQGLRRTIDYWKQNT